MMDFDINSVFNDIIKEVKSFESESVNCILKDVVRDIAEAWGNQVIDILESKRLKPSLAKATIERRERRDDNILSPEHALLETGEWVQYIQFRCKVVGNVGIIDVVIDDYDTMIGHSGNISPYKIALLNEYGIGPIPSRPLFATSELEMEGRVDSIIKKALNESLRDGYNNAIINANLTIGHDSDDTSDYFAIGGIHEDSTVLTFGWLKYA